MTSYPEVVRNDSGKFALKSDNERKVRSIRATDRVWDDFGFMADERRITRADLLEQLTQGSEVPQMVSNAQLGKVKQLLTEALPLKANSGGAIKKKIRQAIALLE